MEKIQAGKQSHSEVKHKRVKDLELHKEMKRIYIN